MGSSRERTEKNLGAADAAPALLHVQAPGTAPTRLAEPAKGAKRPARALPIRSSPVSTAPSLRAKLSALKSTGKRAAPAPTRAKSKSKPKPPFARNPVLQELEPRLLMSADLNTLAHDTLIAAPAPSGAEFRNIADTGAPTVVTSAAVAPIQRTNELVFVDTATPDYQQLIDDMRSSALAQGRNLEFVLIDADKDGIRKITDTLAQKSDLDAIHIISHARDGSVQLGNTQLDFQTLVQRAMSIKSWGNALKAGGDILLYGCDLAENADGKSLVDAIARLTGADVAASTDITGAASLGGNWTLEYQTGAIQASVLVSAQEQLSWDHTLPSSISGTIWEDVNGDANLADKVGAAGVTVRLYRDNGSNLPGPGDALVATTLTNAAGQYSFAGIGNNNVYWVVVDSRTITPSAGLNGGHTASEVWAEETYAVANNIATVTGGSIRAVTYAAGNYQLSAMTSAGAFYGGARGDRSDDGVTLDPTSAVGAEHIQYVKTEANTDVTGVDSAFSFNVIDNTRGDATDDDAANPRMQQGSLRQFILNSNAITGTQTANFSIGTGAATITVASLLPSFTDTVVIDGTTQEGWVAAPIVEITGPNTGTDGLYLDVGSDGSTIKGLILNNFNRAIALFSSNNVVTGNYSGTNAAGTVAKANVAGVWMNSSNNTIGGTSAAERNILSGNNLDGVQINGSVGATGNVIIGNYIGLDVTGTVDLGNTNQGVAMYRGAKNNTVGGTAPGTANVISGNNGEGVRLIDAGTTGNVVIGNLIGTNAAGTGAIGNTIGVAIRNGASGNTIGGTAAGTRNVISGNRTAGSLNPDNGTGLLISDAGSAGNVVQGNYIGTNTAGAVAAGFGNGTYGVQFQAGVNGNTVGGTAAGAGNIIAGNNGIGVGLQTAAQQDGILGNSIFQNTGLGIDLDLDGVTANDGATNVAKANIGMDKPVFTLVGLSGTTLTVAGYVGSSSAPSATFAGARVEIFKADASGQGKTYLGFLTTDATGHFGGSLTVGGVVVGDKLTATATDAANDTSEFGATASVLAGFTVSGTIYNDVSADSSVSVGEGTFSGVTIKLYQDTNGNDLPDAADVLVATTTTGAGGAYSVAAPPNGVYWVVVDSKTIGAAAYNAGKSIADVWADQSYGVTGAMNGAASFLLGPGALYGGKSPTVSDNASALATSEHVTKVTISGSSVGSIDSGFSFNVIDNVRGDTTDDDGGATGRMQQGSLRQFILNANAISGVQVSSFSIGGGGAQTIAPTAAFASITDAVVLDATTQAGFAGTPLIELDGTGSGGAAGFTLASNGSTVRGFVINRFGYGFQVSGNSNLIAGNWIGLDATGSVDRGNAVDGIVLLAGAANNTIGGTAANDRNVISGNDDDGVSIDGASGTVVIGNYVGTNAAGTAAIGNSGDGVAIQLGGVTPSTNTTVGGTSTAERNVISGNAANGSQGLANVRIRGVGTTGNVVLGNYIGTDYTGAVALANPRDGVVIDEGALNNTIGGAAAGAGNVISGSTNNGIRVQGTYSYAAGDVLATIYGNRIGTNAAGTAGLANGQSGIFVDGSSGTAVTAPQRISIGGTGANQGNTIAFNTQDGVAVTVNASRVTIVGNSIYSNGSAVGDLGIDLAADGVTNNDGIGPYDGDTGPNTLQNFPAFSAVATDGTTLTVSGRLDSVASTTYTIHFYASTAIDPSSHGEGQRYLGSTTVLTDASGTALFNSVPISAAVALGEWVSMTATDPTGNTSEFSVSVAAVAANTPPVNTVPGAQSIPEDTTQAIAGISVGDAQTNLNSLQLAVSNGVLNVTASGGAGVAGNGSGSVVITGTQAAINATVASLTYRGNLNYTGPDTLTVTATDAGSLTDVDTATINITAVDDAPTATITPLTYAATEQTTLTLAGTGLSIADVDAGAAAVRATLSVVSGTLTVTAGATGVTVTGSGSNSVTLDGTLAQINNLLAGNAGATASYIINSDTPPASDTLTLLANDLGNTGAGGPLTGSDTATINITAVDDAPTATITPLTYAATEQTTLTLAGTGLSIADVDAGAAAVRATLSVVSGTLTVTAGATGVTVTGSGSNSVTLDGTLAQINNLLAGNAGATASYILNSDTPPASDTLTLLANDLGNTGAGGPLTGSDTATINITAVDDAPTATITPLTYAATEQTTLTLAGTGLSIADVDAGAAAVRATLSVVSGTLTVTAGATGVTVTGSGSNSVTLDGTLAQINNLLAGNAGATASYIINSDTPPASDTLTLLANDLGNTGAGGPLTGSDTATINITAVDDAPTATITPLTYAATEQTTLTLAGTGLSIADVDAGAAAVRATLSVVSGTLTVTAGATGVTVTGSGSNSVTLDGTLAQINNLLAGNAGATASYIINSDTPPASDTLTLLANDLGNTGAGGPLTGSDTATINITAVDDAPTATITPLTYAATEQTTLTLAGTGLSIADVDAGAAAVRATLSVVSGTLTVTAGATGVTVTGSGSNSVTLDGTLAQINNLLAGNAGATASYIINSDTPPASDTLTLLANDLGNTGAGGPLTGSDTATINITAVDDAPTATITPLTYAATEQTTLTLAGTGLSIADVDAGAAAVRATLSVVSGTLTVTAGATGVTVTGSGSNSVTLDGTLAQINNLLAGNAGATASYIINSDTPPASDTLTLLANDLGNTGAGGPLTGSDTATINITAVDDAPTATITPLTYAATEQTTLTLAGTGLSIADVDAGAAAVRATLSVVSGTLTVTAGATGVTVTGSGSNSVTLDGTLAQINNLLAGNAGATASYIINSDTPPASDTLTLLANDLGNTGAGGPLTGSDTATINITAVDDAPTATITPLTYAATEQTTLTLAGTGLSIADVDAGAAAVRATLSVVSGTLTVTAGATGVTVTGSGSNSVTLDGTLAQINNLLAGNAGATASYIINSDTPPASDTLTLLANDLGNTGAGGPLTGSDTATINITAVDDAPTATITPLTYAATEQTTLTLAGTGLSIADVDAGAAAVRATLSVVSGTLTVTAGATGVTVTGLGLQLGHPGRHPRPDQQPARRQRRGHGELHPQLRYPAGERHAHAARQRPGQHRRRRPAHRLRHGQHHRQRGRRCAGEQRPGGGAIDQRGYGAGLLGRQLEPRLDQRCGRRRGHRADPAHRHQRHLEPVRGRRPHLRRRGQRHRHDDRAGHDRRDQHRHGRHELRPHGQLQRPGHPHHPHQRPGQHRRRRPAHRHRHGQHHRQRRQRCAGAHRWHGEQPHRARGLGHHLTRSERTRLFARPGR